MKKLMVMLMAALLAGPIQAEEKGKFSGALFDALRSLSSIIPKSEKSDKEKARNTATIGIRGAETTTSLMSPYWKDDMSADKHFKALMKSYTEAQDALEAGDYNEAVSGFDNVIANDSGKRLAAGATFGKALALAGQGKRTESKALFDQFISDYPDHPLTDEAKAASDSL